MFSTQTFVVDGFQHFVQRRLVVTRVVFETEGAGVGELFFLDEVFGANFGFVHAQLLRQHIDHALNQVDRLGHAEGAAVSHATGRLVGVDPFDTGVCRWNVVAARDNVEHACRELGRVGTGVKRAVVGHHIHTQTGDLAVGGGSQFAVHVVVTGEGRGRDVFDAVFDPLDGTTQHDRGHDGANITGVDAHFVAKATANVGADNAHFGFGDARQHRHHGAHHVRRLRSDEGGQVAFDRVKAGHAATGLQRARVHAGVVHVLRDGDFGLGKSSVCGRLVTGIPSEDVVVVVALAVRTLGLAREVVADHGGAGLQGRIGVEHHGQFFVFDLYRFNSISGDVAVIGNHDGHFLHLEVDLFIGQHGGHVTRQGGHPVQLEGFQVVCGQHGVHAGNGQCSFFVDLDDAAVGDGAAHDVHVQHARHFDVIDIVALALDKASVFFAQARCAHARQCEFAGFSGLYRCVHVCLRSNGFRIKPQRALAVFWRRTGRL